MLYEVITEVVDEPVAQPVDFPVQRDGDFAGFAGEALLIPQAMVAEKYETVLLLRA